MGNQGAAGYPQNVGLLVVLVTFTTTTLHVPPRAIPAVGCRSGFRIFFRIQEMFIQYNYSSNLFTYRAHRLS